MKLAYPDILISFIFLICFQTLTIFTTIKYHMLGLNRFIQFGFFCMMIISIVTGLIFLYYSYGLTKKSGQVLKSFLSTSSENSIRWERKFVKSRQLIEIPIGEYAKIKRNTVL